MNQSRHHRHAIVDGDHMEKLTVSKDGDYTIILSMAVPPTNLELRHKLEALGPPLPDSLQHGNCIANIFAMGCKLLGTA